MGNESRLRAVKGSFSFKSGNLKCLVVRDTNGRPIEIDRHFPGIGATPDGKLAGTTLSDGTVSPAQGRDTKGPTAMLKSATKLVQAGCSSTLLNIKLHPSSLTTREDLKKLVNLVQAYADMGGKWVQFNVIGNEQLLDAQRYPEKHRDLIVRVIGYSACFVDLSKGVQDDIIRRMEVELNGYNP